MFNDDNGASSFANRRLKTMRYARIALLSAAATCLLPSARPSIAQAKPAEERCARQKILDKNLELTEARLLMTSFVAPPNRRATRRAKGGASGSENEARPWKSSASL